MGEPIRRYPALTAYPAPIDERGDDRLPSDWPTGVEASRISGLSGEYITRLARQVSARVTHANTIDQDELGSSLSYVQPATQATASGH